MWTFKLTGPAKVNGRRCRAGDVVQVDEDIFAELAEMDLIGESVISMAAAEGVDLRQVDLSGLPDGKDLVVVTQEQLADFVALKAKAPDEDIIAKIEAERDAALEGVETLTRRVEALEAEIEDARVAHDETRARLEAVQAEPVSTEGAAADPEHPDTPQKKGAAAKTKG